MQIFKISENGLKEIKKKMLVKLIIPNVIVLIVSFVIFTINSNESTNILSSLPFIIVLLVVVSGFGIYRGISRQKTLVESFRLTISNELITREQHNTPTISIHFNDITEITKHKNGIFTIKGKRAVDIIGIPAQIDNYEQLETTLQQIQPIAVKDKISFWVKYQNLAIVLNIGLMLCVFFVNNKVTVALTGSLFVALLVWSFIEIRRSKNIDARTKRFSWAILFYLAIIIEVIITKLTQ